VIQPSNNKNFAFSLFTLTLTMTVIQQSTPLNANGAPLSETEAQVLKNGLPSKLPDIDVCDHFFFLYNRTKLDSSLAFTPYDYPRDNAQKIA
jgi:hypothetical protein